MSTDPKPGRLLPREGFHADVLGGWIRSTLLNPTLTVPLLLFARFTEKGRALAAQYTRAHKGLSVLAVLGAIRALNSWHSRRVVNNRVSDTYQWSSEVVVVTGGSDGIGARIVQMLARKGVKIAVLDLIPLAYTAPTSVKYFQCDITSTEAIAAAAADIRSTLGKPTILVNNAGVCRGKPLLETTDKDLELTFGVNAIAHYKLAREFVPHMVERDHGMVVTVASSAAFVTAPRMTEYAASKAAAMSFHEGLAAELVSTHKAKKVRTVLVNQGYTKTKLFAGFGVKEDAFFGPALYTDTVAEEIVKQILKGESGQLILPGFYKLLAAHFRSLPSWVQYQGRAEMDNLMENWNGRQVDLK